VGVSARNTSLLIAPPARNTKAVFGGGGCAAMRQSHAHAPVGKPPRKAAPLPRHFVPRLAGHQTLTKKHEKLAQSPWPKFECERLQGVAFDGHFRICSEVHKKPQTAFCYAEIIQYLAAMFLGQRPDGFQFHDNLAEAPQIWFISLFNRFPLVVNWQRLLRVERDASFFKFAFQALLIDFLMPVVAHFLVNLEDRTLDGIDLVFV